jgi:hypothetical protein
MSIQYSEYIADHKRNVAAAFEWLREHPPDIVKNVSEHGTIFAHDESKYTVEEYDAYDAYFYGGNRSYAVVTNFRRAWLHHIHNNPHHWQHWILVNDEPSEGTMALEMPYEYVVEMICDWWAFSHKSGNLYEIFDWYDKHKANMILHDNTRKHVERILSAIKNELDSNK